MFNVSFRDSQVMQIFLSAKFEKQLSQLYHKCYHYHHFSTYNYVLYKQRRAVVDETMVYNLETLTWVYEQILKWYSITVFDS